MKTLKNNKNVFSRSLKMTMKKLSENKKKKLNNY